MDKSNRNAPRIIPDAILKVLCILEEDNGRFRWKLSRNQGGLSLVIKSQPENANGQRKRHTKERKKVTQHVTSGNVLEKDSQDPAKTKPLNLLRKHKSPSKIARDKARKRKFIRQKVSSHSIRKNTHVVKTVDSEQTGDSDQSNASVITSVKTTLETRDLEPSVHEHGQIPPIHVADCDERVEECVNSTAQEIDSDDESDFEAEVVNMCAHCSKVSTELEKCSKCKSFRYCSKVCEIFDLPRHKSICQLLQADMCS